jgi:hypothetical protein
MISIPRMNIPSVQNSISPAWAVSASVLAMPSNKSEANGSRGEKETRVSGTSSPSGKDKWTVVIRIPKILSNVNPQLWLGRNIHTVAGLELGPQELPDTLPSSTSTPLFLWIARDKIFSRNQTLVEPSSLNPFLF